MRLLVAAAYPRLQQKLHEYCGLRRFAKFSRLFVPFVGLPFDLLHAVLEAGPFFRSHRHKFNAELPHSVPANYSVLNLNWGFVLNRRNPDPQRGSWLNVGGTFDATTPNGEIREGTLSANHADGGKRAAKLDVIPNVLPLLHRRALQIGMLLPLYIPDWTQFQHFFGNSRTIDRFDNLRYIFVG